MNQIKQLSNFNEMLYQRLQDLEHRLERLKILYNELENKQDNDLENDIDALENTVKQLQNTINSLDLDTLANLQEQYDNINSSITTLSNKIEPIETTLQQHSESIANLENETSDLSALRTQTNDNRVNLFNHQQEYEYFKTGINNSLTDRIYEVNQDISALEEELNSQDQTIISLSTNITQHTQQISNINTEISQLQSNIVAGGPENELAFILNGTYILQQDIEDILTGNYTI